MMMMMNGWMVQEIAEERRRDLAAQYGTSRARRVPAMTAAEVAALAEVVPAKRASALTHPVGPTIGAWLIRAGTRLGGASMRTS